MGDTNLNDDMLKLVRYKILFVKRDYEVAFPEQEELVYDNMSETAFAAWKVAEFIQGLGSTRVPRAWMNHDGPIYPPHLRPRHARSRRAQPEGEETQQEREARERRELEERNREDCEFGREHRGGRRPRPTGEEWFIGYLPEEDKKFLRVYFEVLERYPREKFRHDELQIEVLQEIRDRL